MFVAVELEIRKFFRIEKAQALSSSNEGNILHCVLNNDDILFFWCLVSDMNYIVQLWITIRGFSFTKSYMEIFKRKAKKHLQEVKGALEKGTFRQCLK